ncbi:MAG: hypothetical protein B7Y36_06605 [Novosphingobium sp. 28-62-57]|uniref:hypothetical protein n=1 Tax=unclassified Novosphingobium TaxID=2644732 RepID=UPI000BDCE057|nr:MULTISPECIES: hypothetical protein [unclassified Novosphingobium]OYW51144.1 MAG: hypothetical protein B7Z34_02415 [Novosphingobium sp. 12-62-10]OYZ11035.1 MAG: hypothetical protein B7Y36_06605 [Novosphingobium sp. 28-62-57]OZA30810.1 MAG: hypothetical protein B7X92_15595 [Novosphingobium sp. 17-62-9]
MFALLASVAFATEAHGRDRALDGISCPQMPPAADTVTSRNGGLNLQLLGVGLNGSRAKSTAESDVMVRYGGKEAYRQAVQDAQFCDAIRKIHHGDVRRQLAEMNGYWKRQQDQTGRELSPLARLATPEPVASEPQPASAEPAMAAAKPAITLDGNAAFSELLNALIGQKKPTDLPDAQNTDAPTVDQPADSEVNPAITVSQGHVTTQWLSSNTGTNAQTCSSGFAAGGNMGWMQGCAGATIAGGSTQCVSSPRTSYAPGLFIGSMMIGAMTNTTWSTSCTSTN